MVMAVLGRDLAMNRSRFDMLRILINDVIIQ